MTAAKIPEVIDVAAVRAGERLTQEAFALRYGWSVSNVRAWEQRRKKPCASSRALLLLIEREPEAVRRVLAG